MNNVTIYDSFIYLDITQNIDITKLKLITK